MKQLLTTLVIFSTTSLFIACSNTAEESGTNTATEERAKSFELAGAKKTIESLNVEFGNLVTKADSAGLAALYTSDGKIMPPNSPAAAGKSGIQSTFNGLFAATGPIELKLTAIDVWGTEELLSEEGTYTMTDKTGKQIDKGKYIVLWKMEDGKWKIFRDIFNSDNPPPPSK